MKTRCKRSAIKLLFSLSMYGLCVAFCFLPFIGIDSAASALNYGTSSDISLLRTEESTDTAAGMTIDSKTVAFSSGDEFSAYRIRASYIGAAEPFSFRIKGRNGKATYYDPGSKEWHTVPLSGNLPQAALFIETDEEYVMLGPAAVYKPHGDGNMQDIGQHGIVSVIESGASCRIQICYTFSEGTEAHLWMMRSAERITEWNDKTRDIWQRLDFNGDHRICYDGAYYISPSNYIPSGSGMYSRIPAVHPVLVLIEEPDRVSAELSIVLLEEAIARQNGEGYWETPAESLWLKEDYGISSGFYDTRFNNDVTMRLFSAYRRFGDERYLEAGLRQADWLLRYTRANHFPAGDGILAEDYGGADITKTAKTHCSLNHLLQEIKVLLTAYELTGDAEYGDLAGSMLEGIRDTEHLWISGENGLHYSIKPDLSNWGQDYPCLTYNDLYEVQEMLEVKGGRDPCLDRLMASKLRYMLKNEVTGYKTYSLKDMPMVLRTVLNEFSSVRADPGDQKIEIDGTVCALDAYLIRSENYVRLRDLAAALDGTGIQFEIEFDDITQTVRLETGKPYTRVGNELSLEERKTFEARLSTQEVTLDGRSLRLEGYTINGSNYYRLRDLGAVLGFDISWDQTTQTVRIRTSADK